MLVQSWSLCQQYLLSECWCARLFFLLSVRLLIPLVPQGKCSDDWELTGWSQVNGNYVQRIGTPPSLAPNLLAISYLFVAGACLVPATKFYEDGTPDCQSMGGNNRYMRISIPSVVSRVPSTRSPCSPSSSLSCSASTPMWFRRRRALSQVNHGISPLSRVSSALTKAKVTPSIHRVSLHSLSGYFVALRRLSRSLAFQQQERGRVQ